MSNIILASQSPRRRELLNKLGVRFRAVTSNYEEDMTVKMKPKNLAKFLSKGKAEDVAARYKKHIVIGADTFIALGDQLLGKPHTMPEARKMLKKISGKTLSVISGFTVIDTGKNKSISRAIETKVHIKKLSPSEINNYVKTKEPLDKAGAFAIQELGAVIVRKIEGDFFNVMGLPVYDLEQTLRDFGVKVI